MSQEKLFLLDGMALFYRAFFAFSQNPRITSYGLNSSAMFGFTNTLLDILNKQKPTHIAVVLDTDKPTHRHIEFEAYKAQRESMPEDLRSSFPYLLKILDAFNIPVLLLDGYEADDIIGTLAHRFTEIDVFMMTPDKDFGQLVNDHIFIYKPGRMGNPDEILGVKEILVRWEIDSVEKVIDILGLWGDAVDNIPGVPGVGEKTAKKLIQEYNSVEGVIANAHQLKGKMKEKFIEFQHQALLSKKLATIDLNVPIEVELLDLILKPYDFSKIEAVFNELEFKTMLRRIQSIGTDSVLKSEPKKIEKSNPSQTSLFDLPFEQPIEVNDFKTIDNTEHAYKIILTQSDWNEVLSNLENVDEFCFDTETTDLNIHIAELVGISISWAANQGCYFPIPVNYIEAKDLVQRLQPVFLSSKMKIAQNLKFDLAILSKYNLKIEGPFFDTMIAHYLLEPDHKHNMQVLSEKYLNYTPVSIEELIGKKGKNQGSMRDVELETIAQYASEDTDITLQLKQVFAPLLKKYNLESLFENIEIPLISVLELMEKEGIRIDSDFLVDYSKELNRQALIIQDKIFEIAGSEFNISSPQQVGLVLFEKLKLSEKPKKTKTGQYQTDEETLNSLVGKHEIVELILNFRTLQKLKSTYVDSLPLLVNSNTNRVHTSFNQAVAATGRLSSQNPNLQNIPIRTDLGKEIRKAFVPRDEQHVLLSADYSQIELRIIAHISNDSAMIEAFNSGLDIHTATASKVWKVAPSEVDKEMRRKAKTVNFGIIYGISAFGLSQRVQIPRSEAKEIIDTYFNEFSGIKDYMEKTIQSARELGFVETITGRRRIIRDINSANATVRGFSERNAINAPIQGSAADMIKIAMIKVNDWLRTSGLKTKMILQVHDELLFDVPKSELEIVVPKIKHYMENAMVLSVPIIVETGFGNNWLEAH
jgi:DNA polymerase-1